MCVLTVAQAHSLLEMLSSSPENRHMIQVCVLTLFTHMSSKNFQLENEIKLIIHTVFS